MPDAFKPLRVLVSEGSSTSAREAITILGHNMRGSGDMFGFQAITDIGAALQQAAESADAAESRKWVGELSNYLDVMAHTPRAVVEWRLG